MTVKRFIGLFLVIIGLLMTSPFAFAQDFTATVSTDALNVRSTPNGADVIGTLSVNETVQVLEREDEQGNGGVWVRVQGSVTGWVLIDYLNYTFDFNALPISGSAAAAAPQTDTDTAGDEQQPDASNNANAAPPSGNSIPAQVVADSNVRSGPGQDFGRIFGVTAGNNISLTGRNADSSWVYGNFPEGTGWISASLIVADSPIAGLDVTNADGSVISAAPAADAPAEENAAPAASVNNPPPVGGGGISGFAYGAHIADFGGVELMQQSGMTWIKKQVRYNRGMSPDSVSWIINDGKGLGFRVMLGVVGSPSDIAAGGDAYFQEFANFVGGLAGLGADAIEVWNEPNIDREWPTGQVDPAFYTQLLALSYNAIKGANPNTIVISGAPAPTGFFGGCTPNGCDDNVYIAGLAAAGAAQYMDCVGAHYNEGVVAPTIRSGDPRSEHYSRYYGTMVDTYATLGKPICFTELGYVTPDGYGGLPAGFAWGNENTIAEHAQWLADAITLAARDSRVSLVIVWNFNFRTDPSTPDPAGGYAMLRPDGSCPACAAIAARR